MKDIPTIVSTDRDTERRLFLRPADETPLQLTERKPSGRLRLTAPTAAAMSVQPDCVRLQQEFIVTTYEGYSISGQHTLWLDVPYYFENDEGAR